MTSSGLIYTASEGETWDSVSLLLYEDEKYAAELMTANPTVLLKMNAPFFLGGEVLRVPVVEVPETDGDVSANAPSVAPWRQFEAEEAEPIVQWEFPFGRWSEQDVDAGDLVLFDCGTSEVP